MITPFPWKVQEMGGKINGESERAAVGSKNGRQGDSEENKECERHRSVRLSRNIAPYYTQEGNKVNSFVSFDSEQQVENICFSKLLKAYMSLTLHGTRSGGSSARHDESASS
jgi:hypothetical protein